MIREPIYYHFNTAVWIQDAFIVGIYKKQYYVTINWKFSTGFMKIINSLVPELNTQCELQKTGIFKLQDLGFSCIFLPKKDTS